MFRRRFLQAIGAMAAGLAIPGSGRAGDYDFRFTRLMYESGNCEVDERMPSNLAQ